MTQVATKIAAAGSRPSHPPARFSGPGRGRVDEPLAKQLVDPTAPGPVDLAGGWAGLLPALAIFVATCVVAVWVFRREAPRIAEKGC